MVTASGLGLLTPCANKITRLKIVHSDEAPVTDTVIHSTLQDCQNLTILLLDGCKEITSDSLNCLPQTLTILHLERCIQITDNGLRHIVNNCPNVTELYLHMCSQVTDAALQHVVENLPKLRILRLPHGTKLEGDIQRRYQIELARKEERLAELLETNDIKIEDIGTKVISAGPSDLISLIPYGNAITSIRLLNVDSPYYSSRTAASIDENILLQLLRHFPNLTKLDLQQCPNITNLGLQYLKDLPLTNLDLIQCQKITDEGLRFLGGLNKLTTLSITSSEVTDRGLGYLPKTLTSLYLTGCSNITDVGLQYLKDLPLTDLFLSYCSSITDAGLQHLPKSLTQLRLAGCTKITSAGLQHLNEMLLTGLSLEDCHDIKDEEIMYIIEHFPNLQILGLAYGHSRIFLKGRDLERFIEKLREKHSNAQSLNNSVADTDAMAIIGCGNRIEGLTLNPRFTTNETLKTIRETYPYTILALDGCTQITDDGLACLENMLLTKLGLVGCTKITSAGLRHLPKSLTVLNLSDTNITDISIQIVEEQCPNLTALYLSGCKNITDKGLEHLQYVTSLTYVDLINCNKITDKGLKALKEISLTHLDLSGCRKITDDGLRHLPKSLNELYLARCSNITDSGLRYVENMPLNKLNLVECSHITDDGIQLVAEQCPNLTELNLWMCSNITDKGLEHLQGMPLTHLYLVGCYKITDGGLKSIATHCSNTTYLDLLGCEKVTNAGLLYLCNLANLQFLRLPNDKELKEGDLKKFLKDIVIGLMKVSAPDLEILMPWADKITKLQLVHTEESPITDTDVQYVSENFPSLATLSLNGCFNITDKCLEYLKEIEHLKELDLLGCNQITYTALSELRKVKGLKINVSLSLLPDEIWGGIFSQNELSCKDLAQFGLVSKRFNGLIRHELSKHAVRKERDGQDQKKLTPSHIPDSGGGAILSKETGPLYSQGLIRFLEKHIGRLKKQKTGPKNTDNERDEVFLVYPTELVEFLKEQWIEPKYIEGRWVKVSPLELSLLLPCADKVGCLSLLPTKESPVLSKDIEFLVEHFPLITNLDLSDAQITDEDLEKIVKRYKELTYLSINNCKEITDKGIQALIENCPHIIDLSLINTQITDYGIEAITKKYPNLDSLEKIVHPSKLPKLAPYRKYIKRLQLCSTKEDPITGETLALLKDFPNLIGLDLSGEQITDSDLLAITQYCPHLTKLNLCRGRGITKVGSLYLSEVYPRGCGGITELGFSYLPKLTQLRKINLAKCSISDKVLHYIGNLENLTSLNLAECKDITDLGMAYLSNKKLAALNLYGCHQITDTGIGYLSELPSLTYLRLSCQVTDNGLKHLANLNENTILDLFLWGNITDAGLEYLGRFKNINSLTLAGCHDITGRGLSHLADASNMIYLDFQGCEHIRGNGLKALESMPRLTELDLRSTQVTDNGLLCLRKLPILQSRQLPHDIWLGRKELKRCLECFAALPSYSPHKPVPFLKKQGIELEDLDTTIVEVSAPELNLLTPSASKVKMLRLVHHDETPVTDADVKEVIARCPKLVGLYLSGCKEVTNDGILEIPERHPNLLTLELCDTKVTDSALKSIVERCPNLTWLHLPYDLLLQGREIKEYFDWLSALPTSLTDLLNKQEIKPGSIGTKVIKATPSDLGILAWCAEKVAKLKLVHSEEDPVTDTVVEVTIGSFPNLTELDLTECKEICGVGLFCLDKAPYLRTLHLPTGERLNEKRIKTPKVIRLLRGDSVTDNHLFLARYKTINLNLRECFKITDADIMSIVHCWHDLLNLDLSECTKITDVSIEAVAQNCTKLVGLYLENTQVTDHAVETIAKYCHEITQLNLGNTNVTHEGLASLKRLPKLQCLVLPNNIKLEGEELRKHLTQVGELPLVELLKKQDIRVWEIERKCVKVSPLELRLLLPCADRVRSLELHHSNDSLIISKDIEFLIQNFPMLTHLDLDKAPITDEDLEKVAHKYKGLTYLSINNCKEITDKGIQALMEHCLHITHLYLMKTQVTDKGIEAIVKKYPNLTALNPVCPNLTDKGLNAIARCTKLTWLYLGWCRNVNDDHLKAISKNCKDLTMLVLENTGVAEPGLTYLKDLPRLQAVVLPDCTQLEGDEIRKYFEFISSSSKEKEIERTQNEGKIQEEPKHQNDQLQQKEHMEESPLNKPIGATPHPTGLVTPQIPTSNKPRLDVPKKALGQQGRRLPTRKKKK